MTNPHVLQRLVGLQTILNGVHQSGASLSSSSKGTERAQFIDSFLSQVLPPVYRFGTGDATDAAGARSGQLDVVVEFPIAPSLPAIGSPNSRLYIAEAIAAVIEVKSDVGAQWAEAQRTAAQLAPLKRTFGASMIMGLAPTESIPLIAVGYTGWSKMATIQSHLASTPEISAVLVIDAGLFVSGPQYGGITATGPLSLWGLIGLLHMITNGLQAASTDPFVYC